VVGVVAVDNIGACSTGIRPRECRFEGPAAAVTAG